MSVCRPRPEQNVSHATLFTDTDKRLLLRATLFFQIVCFLSEYRYRYADPDPKTETCNRGLKQITLFVLQMNKL